jgi:hypothetical protein
MLAGAKWRDRTGVEGRGLMDFNQPSLCDVGWPLLCLVSGVSLAICTIVLLLLT